MTRERSGQDPQDRVRTLADAAEQSGETYQAAEPTEPAYGESAGTDESDGSDDEPTDDDTARPE